MFEGYSKVDFLSDAVQVIKYQKLTAVGWWHFWGYNCNKLIPSENLSDLDKLLDSVTDVLLDRELNTEEFWAKWLKEAEYCLALHEVQKALKELKNE